MMELVLGLVRWVIEGSVSLTSALKRLNGNPPTAAHRPGIGTVLFVGCRGFTGPVPQPLLMNASAIIAKQG